MPAQLAVGNKQAEGTNPSADKASVAIKEVFLRKEPYYALQERQAPKRAAATKPLFSTQRGPQARAGPESPARREAASHRNKKDEQAQAFLSQKSANSDLELEVWAAQQKPVRTDSEYEAVGRKAKIKARQAHVL